MEKNQADAILVAQAKRNKINSNLVLFSFLIIIATLFIATAYATISSTILNIEGTVIANSQDGIFITDVVYESNNNANINESKINKFFGAILNSTVSLSETDGQSSITYNITMYNSSDTVYGFDKVMYETEAYSNPNIEFKLDGLNYMDKVESKQSITFSITFRYLNNEVPSTNILNSLLKFSFKKIYSVTYVNITDNNYSKEVLEGSIFQVTFEEPIPVILDVNMNENVLEISEYAYIEGILKIPNVTGNIVIESKDIELQNNSIYDWKDNHQYDKGVIQNTINVFNKLNISEVYRFIERSELNTSETKRIISNLKDNGINVYFLTGNPEWYTKPETVTSLLDEIYNYNQSVAENEKLDGLVLDIEPYTLEAYKADKITGFETYANTMETIYTYAQSKNIKIINAIPYWYDSYTTNSDFTTEEQQKAEQLLRKIFQNADKISVMNYYKTAMVKNIKTEVEYAKEYGKEIESIAEFGNIEEVNTTLWNEDKPLKYANTEWQKVYNEYNYNKLTFSYHYLTPILQILGEYKATTFEFVDVNGNVMTRGNAIINYESGDTSIIGLNDVEVLPINVEYTISSEDYYVDSFLREEDLGENGIKKVYLVKSLYTLEVYADCPSGTGVSSGTIKLIDTVINKEIVKECNTAGNYFIFTKIMPNRKYNVIYIDSELNEYPLESATAKDDNGVKQTISDENGNIIIPPDIKTSNYYIGPKFIFSKNVKPEYTLYCYVRYNGLRLNNGTMKLINLETNEEIIGEYYSTSSDSYYRFRNIVIDTKFKVLFTDIDGVEYVLESANAKDETVDKVVHTISDNDGNIIIPDIRPSTYKLYPNFYLKKSAPVYSVVIYTYDLNGVGITRGNFKLTNIATNEEFDAPYNENEYFEFFNLTEDIEYKINYTDEYGNQFTLSSATATSRTTAEDGSDIVQTISNDNGNIIIPTDFNPKSLKITLSAETRTYRFSEIYVKYANGTRVNNGTLKIIDTITNQQIEILNISSYQSGEGTYEYYFSNKDRIFSNRQYQIIYTDADGNVYDVDYVTAKNEAGTKVTISDENGLVTVPSDLNLSKYKLYPTVYLK